MRPGEIAFERFVIERKAGSGAMGTVFQAKDRLTGERVALKVLHGRDAIDTGRFEREAAVLAALTHPGIVRYVAHGSQRGEHYLAMEWLEGQDLSARLASRGLSIGESVGLVRLVAEALAVAHKKGVVHRDIKPSNLFLCDGSIERVKLLDFGIARFTREGRGVTLTGAMLGTPGYMAPEQAHGARDLDTRADVFSLGCVLFKCLTGRAVFTGENILAVLAKTIVDEAPRVRELRSDVPAALDELVARLLSKNPTDRPTDAAAVALEIAAVGDLPVAGAAAASDRLSALTASERRVVCVLIAGGPAGMLPEASTLTMDQADAREAALRRAVDSRAGRLDFLADGSLLVTLSGTGAATDQAARAARCALEMRAVLPDVPMALATGTGILTQQTSQPVGDLIDRGVRMLAHGSVGVRLDDATAGLLDVRFEVNADAMGLYLTAERDVVAASRTLLGKPYPCVGRDKELTLLEGIFSEVVAEPIARAVLMTGAAGRGKSRIRYELLRRIHQQVHSVEVLIGRGDSVSAGSPFSMLAPAIRRSAGILDGEPPAVKYRRLRARVARHLQGKALARVSEFLGEMISVRSSEEESEALRSARQDPMLMADAMLAAWEDWLEAECLAQPVVIVLEDLHWGDLPSVRFVDAALRHLASRPLFVFALARPEVHTQFPGLWVDREVQEMRLGLLTPKASERLAREVLGDTVDDRTMTRVVERSGGNAFYLEEIIRAVAGGAKSALLPETVLGMVQTRLDAMGSDAKRVLRAASVFGQEFWRGGVAALLGGDHAATGVKEWLDELVAREVIAPRGIAGFQGEAAYIFRHALLRDAAYAMLTDADRALGHKLAAGWLERVGETDAMVLAEHLDRGGEPARAAVWYGRAAEQALGANDLAAAIERAERGIERGASGDQRGALRLVQAEAHRWRGELQQAEARALLAVKDLAVASDAWFRAAGELIALIGQQGGIERLLPWIEEATDITMGSDAASAHVICLCRAAMALLHAGRHDEADALLRHVEVVAGDTSRLDRIAAARVHQARGTRALQAGRAGAALAEYVATIEAFDDAGDARNVALTRINLGLAYAELGELGRAEPALRQARAAAERMGLHNVAGWAQNNLGNVLVRKGALEEARLALLHALEAGRKQGNLRLEVASRMYLARLALAAGDAAIAEREARAGADLARDLPPLRTGLLATLACSILASAGEAGTEARARRADEARGCAAEALALLDSMGGAAEGETVIRLAFAEVAMACGDIDAARGAIAAARDRLLGRASTIDDPALRESFLTRVAENARTLELARAWE